MIDLNVFGSRIEYNIFRKVLDNLEAKLKSYKFEFGRRMKLNFEAEWEMAVMFFSCLEMYSEVEFGLYSHLLWLGAEFKWFAI